MAFLYLNGITSNFNNLHLYYSTVSCLQSIMLRNYASLILLLRATAIAISMNDMEKRAMAKNFTEVNI
jgi:hypothetical protein